MKYMTKDMKFTGNYSSQYTGRLFWILILIITLFGIVQATQRFHLSLGLDEPYSVNFVINSIEDIDMVMENDTPLYYLLLNMWVKTFGESEIALRSLSLLFFAGTIIATGIGCRCLGGSFAGIIAALLVSTSYRTGIYQASTVRQYALLGLITTLALLIEIIKIRRCDPFTGHQIPRLRVVWLNGSLILIHIMGLLTHPVYAFFLAALTLSGWYISTQYFYQGIIRTVLATGFYLILWGNIIFRQIQLPITSWMKSPGIADLIISIVNLWGFRNLILLFIIISFMKLNQSSTIHGFYQGIVGKYTVSILVFAFAFPFLFSFVKPVYQANRTPSIFLTIACMVCALLLSRFQPRWIIYCVLLLMSLNSLWSSFRVWNEPDPYPARNSINYVIVNAQCGDYLISAGLAFSEVEYYLRRNNASDCLTHQPFPLEVIDHPGWMDETGMIKHPEALETEASSLVSSIKRKDHYSVWVFYPYEINASIAAILKSEMDESLQLNQVVEAGGSFFDVILKYSSAQVSEYQ